MITNEDKEYNDDWLDQLDWLNLYETAYFSVDHQWLFGRYLDRESPVSFEEFVDQFAIVWENQ